LSRLTYSVEQSSSVCHFWPNCNYWYI